MVLLVYLFKKKEYWPKGFPKLGVDLNHFSGIAFNKKTYFL